MRNEYRVFIQDPGLSDPLAMSVGIYVWREHDRRLLNPDGTWLPVEEGTHPGPPSFTLPRDVMEAFVEAVDAYKGQPSHAKTEASVLREWLEVERARVDKVLSQ
jgi:hypothetical protein